MEDTKEARIEFAKIMYGLGENFSAKITQDGLLIRFEALKEFSIDQIRQAAMQIIRVRKYTTMPTVADFICAIMGDQEKVSEDTAEHQATRVLEEVRRVGNYGTPKFKDEITADIVRRRYTWMYLCSLPEDRLSFFIREFKAAYLAYDREEKRVELDFRQGSEVKKLIENIGT